MKTSEPMKISESEWEVMRVIWSRGSADANTVDQLLSAAKGWKIATVKTLLGRLVKKNALYTVEDERKFIYFPKVEEEQVVKSAAAELFSHICARKAGKTIADLIAEKDLTAADILLIQNTLAAKEPVAAIACDCIPGQCSCK